MTTLDKAKRFANRIKTWKGHHEYRRLWCQSHVARSLIRQEYDRLYKHQDERTIGVQLGLNLALRIIDAVYGRTGK